MPKRFSSEEVRRFRVRQAHQAFFEALTQADQEAVVAAVVAFDVRGE